MSYYNERPSIIWIKSLDELGDPFVNGSLIGIPMLFSKKEVVDHTCEKTWKHCISQNKAEEALQKKKATKKHADCNIEIIDNPIQEQLTIEVQNIYGTHANRQLINNLNDMWYNEQLVQKRDALTVQSNIDIVLQLENIVMDKMIVTKTGKEMRLTKLELKDWSGIVEVTLFDSDIADNLEKDDYVELKQAQVNFYQEVPQGLQIPRWGSIAKTTAPEPKERKPRFVVKEESS